MDVLNIVVTGPESTGKTVLAERLAAIFRTVWVPEYAREYVSGLGRPYRYEDVEHIALEQLRRSQEYAAGANGILFFDTHLVVTKVWFKVVYGRHPDWLDKAVRDAGTGLFQVCNTDIPWVPDGVRENGGEMRERLLEMYIAEIEAAGVPWRLVSGREGQRNAMAAEIVRSFLNEKKVNN